MTRGIAITGSVIVLLWLLGCLSSISLLTEFPPNISSIHWRTYPGMFLWPVIFLPAVAIFLFKPVRVTFKFIRKEFKRPLLGQTMFALPIVLFVVGMSGYEWFNGKYAVWELNPQTAAKQFAIEIEAAKPFHGSLNSVADSIRARSSLADAIPDCRYAGSDRPAYLAGRCFCAPVRTTITGKSCDLLRETLYQRMGNLIAERSNRSYTYYFYRLSFSVMSLSFILALVTVTFMSCFRKELYNSMEHDTESAFSHIKAVSLFCMVWWMQRLYFGYEQLKIFPISNDSVFYTYILSIGIGTIIIIGTIHAFGSKIDLIASFLNNLLIPVLAIISFGIGVSQPEIVMRVLRVTFGVDSQWPALLAFIVLSFGICLFPILSFIRDGDTSLLRRKPVE